MRTLLGLFAFMALFGGCGPRGDTTSGSVMDADLRRHLATVGADTRVDVLVGVGTLDPDEARRGLEAAGVEVRTIAGGVAVARGVRAAIERAAALPWVRQIDRSQERLPSPVPTAP